MCATSFKLKKMSQASFHYCKELKVNILKIQFLKIVLGIDESILSIFHWSSKKNSGGANSYNFPKYDIVKVKRNNENYVLKISCVTFFRYY